MLQETEKANALSCSVTQLRLNQLKEQGRSWVGSLVECHFAEEHNIPQQTSVVSESEIEEMLFSDSEGSFEPVPEPGQDLIRQKSATENPPLTSSSSKFQEMLKLIWSLVLHKEERSEVKICED